MVAASHTRASTLLEIRSTSTAEMDTVPMVAHMQDVSTASGTNEHIGLTNHQSADVSCPEKLR